MDEIESKLLEGCGSEELIEQTGEQCGGSLDVGDGQYIPIYCSKCGLKLEQHRQTKKWVAELIENWIKKYPKDIFREPKRVEYQYLHSKLKEQGLTLDMFSADIYRRVLEELKKQLSGESK